MLKRKIEAILVDWKNAASKKPLVIKGIRQCGKNIYRPEIRQREL